MQSLQCMSVLVTPYNKVDCILKLYTMARLPRSGKNIWKMKFFPGQGKVREFCGWPGKFYGWPGKFRKGLESQGKSGNLKINGYGRQSSENLFNCSRGERMYILMR